MKYFALCVTLLIIIPLIYIYQKILRSLLQRIEDLIAGKEVRDDLDFFTEENALSKLETRPERSKENKQ